MAKTQIPVENVNHPGLVTHVDALKYRAAEIALRDIMPDEEPGITQKEMLERVKITIDTNLFPNGAKSGWWTKTVQLDLEAKGKIRRIAGKPTRWIRLG